MSLEVFLGYAAAFEEAFRSDDFSVIADFFTEDASYVIPGGAPFGKKVEGRNNILRSFKSDVEAFDRKFDERIVEFVRPPCEKEGVVYGPWRALYRKAGVPDLEFSGVEVASFEGNRIECLTSELSESEKEKIASWNAKHASAVGIR